MTVLRDFDGTHPCDRCDHPLKYHAGPEHGTECRVVGASFWRGERIPPGMRAKKCWCDGWVPKARAV